MQRQELADKVAVASWARVVLASGLGLVVVVLVPRMGGGGARPALQTLLLTGGLLAAVTAPVLYLAVRRPLGLGVLTALCMVVYNLLVIGVKFVLAPYGLYQVNQVKTLTGLTNVSDTFGAVLTAGLVFVLYLAVYLLLYRIARSRVAALLRRDKDGQAKGGKAAVVVMTLLLVTALAVSGGGVIVLVGAAGAAQYLGFVFSSAVAGLIALALVVAIALASQVFTSAAERARAAGNVAVLVSFFWLGLYFLALYHVLWVVYILVVTSVWPLKVVVPK
jgi:hypothetical protein